MKNCKTCHLEKDLSCFGQNKYSKDNLNYSCNECRADYEKSRRITKGIVPKLIPTVLDDSKECLRCGQIKSIDLFFKSERGRLGRSAYCKICSKEYDNELKTQNPDKYKESRRKYTQKYRDNNREYWRSIHRIHQFNRKNLIKAVSDGTVTKQVIENVYNIQNCFWCKKYTPQTERTAEHITPLVLGGIHSKDNLTMACISCNCSKLNFKEKNNK